MKRNLIPILPALLAAGALTLTVASPAPGYPVPAAQSARMAGLTLGKHYVEVAPGIWVPVKGERERRNVRFARLVAFWSADQRAVADEHGFPYHRWREMYDGSMAEYWFYPDENRQFIFGVDGGNLIRTTRR